MKVVFRADASSAIGTGHVMRCLTLADWLRRRGAQTKFICRHLTEGTRSRILAARHELEQLPASRDPGPAAGGPAHASWLGVDQHEDARATLESLGDRIDWLVVDHYAIDARWESELRGVAQRLMVIDDLADRRHDCDLLLDQTDEADRYTNLLPQTCERLLGPRYALLRPEFSEARETLRQRDGSIRRLLIFLGGTDPGDITAAALEAACRVRPPQCVIDLVIGADNPHRSRLLERVKRLDDVVVRENPAMSQLFALADLAVGAGGTTSWERAAIGLPTIVIPVAANQAGTVKYLGDRGAAIVVEPGAGFSTRLEQALDVMVRQPGLLKHMTGQNLGLVDGRGSARVGARMTASMIALRPATDADSKLVYEWRTSEEVRKFSQNAATFAWEDHQKWFARTVRSPDKLMLIAESGALPVGVLRFDCSEDEAVISIFVGPGLAGLGLGSSILERGEAALRKAKPAVRRVLAKVQSANRVSRRLFEAAGYSSESHVYVKEMKNG